MAQKIHLPYPIALVLGGAAIGFIPNLHPINFDPNLILVVVLPPILYYAAFGILTREFKKNWRDIFSLSPWGWSLLSMFAIGLIFKMLFPEFPWALAFAFGAIVSPPDATRQRRFLNVFQFSPRLLTILEGENLINDASAFVLYRLAVVASLIGDFHLPMELWKFSKSSQAACSSALLSAIFSTFLKIVSGSYCGSGVFITIPYLTYVLADGIGVSGVLAVVTNGLMGAHSSLRTHHSSLRRILAFATWDIFIILLNCFVFILIGLQLRERCSAYDCKGDCLIRRLCPDDYCCDDYHPHRLGLCKKCYRLS